MKECRCRNVMSIESIVYTLSKYNNKITLSNIFNNFGCVFKRNKGDYAHTKCRILFPTNEDRCNILFDGEAIVPLCNYNYYNSIDDNLSLKDICDDANIKALKYISINR